MANITIDCPELEALIERISKQDNSAYENSEHFGDSRDGYVELTMHTLQASQKDQQNRRVQKRQKYPLKPHHQKRAFA